MKYRRLSPTGDYIFGYGNTSFLTDTAAVMQAVQTKLKLFLGEFWEDVNDGLPFFEEIAGQTNKDSIDLLVRARILETPNVTEVVSFSSTLDSSRQYTATATINTTFGTTTVGVST